MTATWIEQDWRKDAACARVLNPEAWSLPRPRQVDEPVDSESDRTRANNRAAIRVCLRCPVRRACADYALTTDPWPHGVILAGVPCRRDVDGGPSPHSVALLRAVVGDVE